MTNASLRGFANSAVASRTVSINRNVLQVSGAGHLAVVRRPGALSSGLMSRTVRTTQFTTLDSGAVQSPGAFQISSSVPSMSELRPALASVRNPNILDRRRLEFGVDLRSLVASPKQYLRSVVRKGGLADPSGLTYVTFNAYR